MVMIFVTVGTHTQGFERLINAVDELSACGKIKENVVVQIGSSKYEPKNCKWFRFESPEKMAEWSGKARIIITHAGEGSVILALTLKKPIIVVPRYKKFGEHVDDHQLDIAWALEREKMAVAVYDISGLESALGKIENTGVCKERHEQALLISNLRKYLESVK